MFPFLLEIRIIRRVLSQTHIESLPVSFPNKNSYEKSSKLQFVTLSGTPAFNRSTHSSETALPPARRHLKLDAQQNGKRDDERRNEKSVKQKMNVTRHS